MVRETLEFLRPLAQNSGVTLPLHAATQPAIAWFNAAQMQQVLTNLVANAIQAMPHGGAVDVEVRRERAEPPAGCDARAGNYFCISVRDEGEGIPAKYLKHIFDPFFTTKDVGQGSGLGLSIALGIVQEHGGWLTVDSQKEAGSCFHVYLPVPETVVPETVVPQDTTADSP